MGQLLRSCMAGIFAAAFVPAFAAAPDRPSAAVLDQLVPTGKLRVGVAAAPARSALLVIIDAGNKPNGVTVELGRELARRLGVPAEIVVEPNTGELVNATSSGALDVTFVPVDEERKKKLNFGTSYFTIQSTYLVRPGSDIKTLADVDRPNVKVVSIAGSATIRSAGVSLKNTTISAVKSVADAVEMLRAGKADAFALTQDALPPLAARLPGSRILEGSFLQTGIAVAVPKNRPDSLIYVTAFMEDVKASGFVKHAFDHAGLQGLAVAPAGR